MQLALAMCIAMARPVYRWMRYHPHPCLLPLTLVLLAWLSSHIVGQRRWYLPPEMHIVLSNFPARSTKALCSFQPTPSHVYCDGQAYVMYLILWPCLCLLWSPQRQPETQAWFPVTSLTWAVVLPLGA